MTQVRLPVEVSLFVRGQVRRLREPLKTAGVVADVRFLSGVGAQVRSKVEVQAEALVAERALEWFFARVDQLMALELRVVEEALVAASDWADVLAFAVGHQVLAQGARILEQLGTPKHMTRKHSVLFITF